MKHKILSGAIYGLSASIGVIAFVYPFLIPALKNTAAGQAHALDAPLVLTVLVSVCFVVLLFEVQGQAINAKLVALLGILVAMNSVLRFFEVAIPGPGGLSLIFFLITHNFLLWYRCNKWRYLPQLYYYLGHSCLSTPKICSLKI